MVFCPCLVGDCIKDGIYQLVVERGGHPDVLRENGHVIVVGVPVQRLAPPVEFLNAEAGYGIALVTHQRGLFFQCQP